MSRMWDQRRCLVGRVGRQRNESWILDAHQPVNIILEGLLEMRLYTFF